MAGTDLIIIVKDGDTAICERRQLPAMEGAGWELAPEPEPGGEEEGQAAEAIAPAPGLLPMHRDGELAWVDNKTRAAMLEAGWEPGEPEEGEAEDLVDILAALDPEDPDLWNVDGSLKMGAFNETFGRKETRASIEAVAPGFSRDVLLADQGDE